MHLEQAIKDMNASIRQTINDDPGLRGQGELLVRIPGLGDKTVAALLAPCGGPLLSNVGRSGSPSPPPASRRC